MNDRAVSFSGTWDWSTVPAGLAPGVKKVGPASVYEKQAVKSIEIREPIGGRMKHLFVLASIFVSVQAVAAPPEGWQARRAEARKLEQQGNFGEALAVYREGLASGAYGGDEAGGDVAQAHACLRRLGNLAEFDGLMNRAAEVHAADWRVLRAVARAFADAQHHGFIVAGEFSRGHHRGGGRMVYTIERDRARAMQLLNAARALVARDDDSARGVLYTEFAEYFSIARQGGEAWRLQTLTDLETLPDFEDNYYHSRDVGTSVDANGDPLFYGVPESWETARNDGERWRWLLAQATAAEPNRLGAELYARASFLQDQFGVQTMVERYGAFFRAPPSDDGRKSTSGTYELHALAENETIARLATGVRRITLPDEHNHVALYRRLADEVKNHSYAEDALNRLAQIFENRRQYDKAAAAWQESILRHGPGGDNWKRKRQDQIVGNWCRFDGTMTQPAGDAATVGFVFRNGRKASFTAERIKVKELLDDIRGHIKSNPRKLDWERVQLGDIGYSLVQGDRGRYVGEVAAEWDLALEPREKHWDRRIDVVTPLKQPGAYLVTARMADGNVSHVVVWVADTVIAKKNLDQGVWYFVADAVTGKPLPGVNLDFFGYRMDWKNNRNDIQTTRFALFSDADGQVKPAPKDLEANMNWLVAATDEASGRFAFLGFSSVWYAQRHDAEYNETKVFAITDRPVYRPGQKVLFKFWIGQAKYDQKDESVFAGQSFVVRIHDARGEQVHEATLKADAFGGVAGELELGGDAALGVYGMSVIAAGGNHVGGGNFRVEEYKKPEFEVSVSGPDAPVELGDPVQAVVKAKYFFGAPVAKGTVKIKVLRHTHDSQWYPPMPWDWFYGPGYGWFWHDYVWYPGWREWGCARPWPWWWPRGGEPPELVSEREVELREDGTVELTIDTSFAKAAHGDTDHRYEITAEVTDASRRTIVGQGKVVVARQPFKTHVWTDRGHYRVGDVMRATVATRTADGKPVAGAGTLTLHRVTYKDGKPKERVAQRWRIAVDEEGTVSQQLTASEPGQYRLACVVKDAAGHAIEGAVMLVVRGGGFDGGEFRFNALELTPEKAEYAPGERVRLMINTDKREGTVALFVRPANGVYLPPEILRLNGKSTVHEIEVSMKDMPNFFIEALTIADGRVYTETREIVVPPEKRVLNLEVASSAPRYQPGGKARVTLKLTDFAGKPFVGSTVVTVYDKALEYISGGSNVSDIREFFWKWRRHHQPQTEDSISTGFSNVTPKGKDGMAAIGVFGASLADDAEGFAGEKAVRVTKSGGIGRSLARRDRAGAMPRAPMALAAAAQVDGMDMEVNGMAFSKSDAVAMDRLEEDGAAGGSAEPAAAMVQPTVRSTFADLVFWTAALETDTNGLAEVELDMPENLTTWKIKSWAMGQGTRVGQGETEVITSKNVIIRLQAPRFFVEKDEVVLSAVVHNYLASAKDCAVSLELGGETLELLDAAGRERRVRIEAGGESRVDWRVRVLREGDAVVTMAALTDEESDAMKMNFPVYVHGMLKMESFSGAIRPDGERGRVTFRVPAERRPEQSRLEVRFSPTLAGAMVDALPYLVEYPYGCTEQTLSRFLPTVLTQKALRELGLDLAAIRDKQTNLNAQEIGDDRARATQWKRWDRNPVFDEEVVRDMVRDGLKRLTEMQCSDGGWGWFSGWGEKSYPHTTAYVVHGLQVARANDVAIVPGVLENGIRWLARHQKEQVRMIQNAEKQTRPWKTRADDLDAFVFMVLVEADELDTAMRDFLYRDRNDLSVYAKAMAAIGMHTIGQTEKRDMLRRNIEQFLKLDDENQTAWLELGNQGYWWNWYGSEIEAHAYYLKLLNRVAPGSETAARLVKYLLNNRKHATYWNSTRDTAVCIEAMAEYLKASGEDKPDMTVELYLDGRKHKEVRITPEVLFQFDNRLVLEGDAIETGEHTLEIVRKGKGPLYYNAYLTNFTLEDFIGKAGLEVKVERAVYRLDREDKTVQVVGARGQAVGQKVEKYNRVKLENDAVLKSGDLVEVELTIESKNDYEYLVFEDFKAAGFEAVDARSGYTGNDMGAYVEFRDERVAFFVRQLARGKHSVAYRLRAEIPGRFSALPARGYAMYAPELKGNSDEIKLRIED